MSFSKENSNQNHERRRKYISHGHCVEDDKSWIPHSNPIEPTYTNSGPDWESSLRYIPSPKNEEGKNESLWPEKSSHIRTYPSLLYSNYFVWNPKFENIRQDKGKKCIFTEGHLKSKYSCDEITDQSKFGSKRKLQNIDVRNGFNDLSLGDKVYQAVEYSPDFYKNGVTVPVVPFGRISRAKHDTFIPIFPYVKGSDYNLKRNDLMKKEDVLNVKDLDCWEPSKNAISVLYTNPFSKIKAN